MSIETKETTRARVKAAFGFDQPSALDLVKRSDYPDDESYLGAAAKAEMERSDPAYREARNRLKAEYEQRQAAQRKEAQDASYKRIRADIGLDELDRRNIDAEAAELARRDLAANRISVSALGETIEKYAAELGEKRKDEKAAAQHFNAILRGQI